MRLGIVFILNFLIFGCSDENGPRTESVSQVTTATSTPRDSPFPELKCENISGIIGSADIDFDASTVLYFYNQPDSSQPPAQTLRFYDDDSLKMYSFRAEGERPYFELNPERHKLDYSLFDLAVRSRREGWLEVVVGEQNNETLWLKEGKHVRLRDWLRSMKGAFAVGRRDAKTNPLHTKPDATAQVLRFNGRDCFKVEDMQGDWIKVVLQNHCSDAPEQSVVGWLRWRDENDCLLVEIFPFA
jgi:hypothetical protein